MSVVVSPYRDADLGFGSYQAKEMLDHLESVLANDPVAVKSGQFIVEVKPQVCHILTFSFDADLLESYRYGCKEQLEY
uniref:Trehalose synthase n=1 Tax=Solanum tuberosum TaxID=4113 RepID=M1DE98_SOLTU